MIPWRHRAFLFYVLNIATLSMALAAAQRRAALLPQWPWRELHELLWGWASKIWPPAELQHQSWRESSVDVLSSQCLWTGTNDPQAGGWLWQTAASEQWRPSSLKSREPGPARALQNCVSNFFVSSGSCRLSLHFRLVPSPIPLFCFPSVFFPCLFPIVSIRHVSSAPTLLHGMRWPPPSIFWTNYPRLTQEMFPHLNSTVTERRSKGGVVWSQHTDTQCSFPICGAHF